MTVIMMAAVAALAMSPAVASQDPQWTLTAAKLTFTTDEPQGDAADSLYRSAQAALARNELSLALDRFRALPRTYPRSRLIADALYWEAFVLYRWGGRDNLRQARVALERHRERHPRATTRGDADALLTRVHGELARLGDAESVGYVQAQAARVATTGEAGEKDKVKPPKDPRPERDKGDRVRTSNGCEREGDDMRIAALNAVMQMDDEQAIPLLREVLKKRTPCSETLRKKAVFILAQTSEPEAGEILVEVIRSDPDPVVRKEAVRWMGEVRGDRVITILDSVLRASEETGIRDAALFALSQHKSPRAREAIRRYASAPDTPETGRYRAIVMIGQNDGTGEDSEFLVSLYPKLVDRKAKQAVIHALGEIETRASWDFLMRLATNPREELSLRKDALFWAEQGDVPTSELIAVESKLDDPKLREHYIFVLSERDDPAALDRLFAIARSHQDVELRKRALFWLGQKRDPRVRQLLLEIIDQ